jgi:hypothetical protein
LRHGEDATEEETVAWVLVASSTAGFFVAFVYSFVAFRLYRRAVSSEARLASTEFSIFWYALGLSSALTAIDAGLAAAGDLSLSVAITVSLLGVLVDCVFLWAIVGYLVYVYTGRYHFALVAGSYGLFYVVAMYYVVLEHPYALVIRAGVPTLMNSPVNVPALTAVVLVGLLFPEYIGAILYLSLLRRTQDRTQRFRITVVGSSILAWFSLTFFYPTSTTAETFERAFLMLIPAALVLVAYLPPEWMRTRFRITGVGSSAPQQDAPARRERAA